MRPFLMRFGLCALGLLYVAMGVVSARVAWLGAREKEQGVGGALKLLLDGGHGSWLLAGVAAGLAALAVARGLDAFRGRRGVIARIGLFVDALGYAVLSWTAVALLLHLTARRPSTSLHVSAMMLSTPGRGAMRRTASVAAASGAGSCRRSIFPWAVSGQAASNMNADGTM
jgi:hypothetical protein